MFFPIPTTKYTKIKFWKLYARQKKKKKDIKRSVFEKQKEYIHNG